MARYKGTQSQPSVREIDAHTMYTMFHLMYISIDMHSYFSLGPYMFGFGLVTFLLSKEIWVVEHNFADFLAFFIASGILIKKLGPGVSKYLDEEVDVSIPFVSYTSRGDYMVLTIKYNTFHTGASYLLYLYPYMVPFNIILA